MKHNISDSDQASLASMSSPTSIDLLLPDCNGLLRGKRIDGSKLLSAYTDGINLPLSLMASQITGESNEASGLGMKIGDKDVFCYPIEGSLSSIPWKEKPSAQLLLEMLDENNQPFAGNPRVVLSNILDKLKALHLNPVIAVELEFFLTDKQNDHHGKLQPPRNPTTGNRDNNTQVYFMADLDSYSSFIEDVQEAAKQQSIPAEAAVAEYAPGQFEINVAHSGDVLKACDEAILLKRVIKAVAEKHGVQATFMAKPYVETAGSGTHIHVSLLDDEGNNVFSSPEHEPCKDLQQAIAGLQQTMHESMLMFAPNANSYRRFQIDNYVPMNTHWSYNNRTVALRIPASNNQNRRIEHRVSGADANPYLVVAAVLGGIHTGLTKELECSDPIIGNAYAKTEPTNPNQWMDAINIFSSSQWAKECFGKEFHHLFSTMKQGEQALFDQQITPLEYQWYLNSV